MGTLKVDNIQKRDGTALITDGAASTNLLSQAALRSAGVHQIKLATASASSSSEIAFDNTIFTSDFKTYIIRINSIVLSSNVNFRFAESPDNGSTYSFTSKYGYMHVPMGTGTPSGSSGSTTNYHEFVGWNHPTSGKTQFYEFVLHNFTTTQTNKLITVYNFHQNNNGNPYIVHYGFESSLTTAQNHIKFYGASGNITSGEFTVYGVVE